MNNRKTSFAAYIFSMENIFQAFYRFFFQSQSIESRLVLDAPFFHVHEKASNSISIDFLLTFYLSSKFNKLQFPWRKKIILCKHASEQKR